MSTPDSTSEQRVTLSWDTTVRFTADVPLTVLIERLKTEDDYAEDFLNEDGTLNLGRLLGSSTGQLDILLANLEAGRDVPDRTQRAEQTDTLDRDVYSATKRDDQR